MHPDQTPPPLRALIDAIANRPNQTDTERQARAQTALAQMEALTPTDSAEVLFAGQIVLFQTLILDAVNDAHAAETPADAYKHRQQAIALGRVQKSWIVELRRHRAQQAAAQQAAADPQPTPEPPPTPEPQPEPAAGPEPTQPAHPFDPPRQAQTPPLKTPRTAGATGHRAHPTRHAAASMRWT